jgi:hypothetical protein
MFHMSSPGPGILIADLRPGLALAALAFLICIAVPCGARAENPPASLEVEPVFCDLGYLSLDTPLDSEIRAGTTHLRVVSSVDWQIEILMPAAPRRLDNGGQTLGVRHPVPPTLIPEGLFSLQPCVVAAGRSSDHPQQIKLDWREVASALERILDPLTPPGTYQASLLVRLIDGQGRSLADCLTTTVQFDIAGWVRMSEEIPPVEMNLDGASLVGEVFISNVTSILMTGNTAWQLSVAQAGEMVSEDGRTEIPRASLTVSVPREIPGGESKVVPPGSLGVDGDLVTVYIEDSAPDPDGNFAEIPVVVRLDSDEPLPAGRYRLTLVFEARAQEPLP